MTAPTTAPATPPAPQPANSAPAGFNALVASLNAEAAKIHQEAQALLTNPGRTDAQLAALAAQQDTWDRKAAQLETFRRSLSAAPVEVAPLATLDADAVVEPLDLKEFPPLNTVELQATGYAKGLEKQELDAREGLHQTYAKLSRYTARLGELKAAMGKGLSDSDLRFEAFMGSRPASHPLTFEEVERVNQIKAIRQAHHEYQQIRERVGNLKSRMPHYAAEVRRVRGEIAKEAEREAARKKLAANHLGPKW